MALGLVGAVLGGIAGAQGSNQSQTSSVRLAPESELEKQAGSIAGQQLGSLNQLVGAGAGQQDVESGLRSQRGLASMLESFSAGNFLPSAQDNATAQAFAQTQFQPRQLALQNAFEEQEQRAAQLASRLGRTVNDPIIQARLAQEQTRQQAGLAAEQQAFGSQFAMNLPQQRLGFTAQLADVNNNLASQAMANRQALLSMGAQLQSNERNFRLQTATRTNSAQGGGGLAGAISGALGGFGAFTSVANLFGGGQSTGSQSGAGNTGYLGVNTNLGGASNSTPTFGSTNYLGQLGAGISAGSQMSQAMAPQVSSYNMPAFSQEQPYFGTQAFTQKLPSSMQNMFNPYANLSYGGVMR